MRRAVSAHRASRAARAGAARARSAPRRCLPRRREQLVGLDRRVAELEQAVARERARVVAAPGDDRLGARRRATFTPTFSRSSTMIRSAVRLPIPGTAWKRAASPAAMAAISSRGGPPERTASATFGPTAWTESSIRNRSRSCSVCEAVERERVVAHDQVRMQRHVVAHGRDMAQRLGGHRQPGSRRRHKGRPRGRSGGPRPRPAAARSPSSPRAPVRAARSWRGRSRPPARPKRGPARRGRQLQQLRDHARHLVLLGPSGAAHRALHLLWRVRVRGTPRCRQRAARLPAPARRRTRYVRCGRSTAPRSPSHRATMQVDQRSTAPWISGNRRSSGTRRRSRSRRRRAPAGAVPALDHAVSRARGAGVDAEDDHRT